MLSNAIKFSEPFDTITVKVNTEIHTAESLNVVISVEDQGIGIKEEDQKNLFEPYFRTTDPRNREMNANSHGLGLSICYGIIKGLGGNLWCTS